MLRRTSSAGNSLTCLMVVTTKCLAFVAVEIRDTTVQVVKNMWLMC